MKQGWHAADAHDCRQINTYRCIRSAGLLMSGMAGLFLGCAATPEKEARAPNAAVNLADIRPGGIATQRMKIALVALPDRIYEIPLNASARTAVAPSTVATAPRAPAHVPAHAPVHFPVNVALAGSLPVALPVIEPLGDAAATTLQHWQNPAAQPATATAMVSAAAESSAQPMAVAQVPQTVKLPAALTPVVAQAAVPKLKLDTDYESVKHPIMFAFNRSALGRQAQALMAKILPDAKVATQVKLTGYSDSIGTRAANERVAIARAHSIRDELVRNDIEPGKISVEPVVIMGLPKTKQPSWYYAQYRRVDVDITKRKPAQMISLADPAGAAK